jgi:hypothetical protein
MTSRSLYLGYYNTNKVKKDPINAANPNAIIPASEVEELPDGGTYAVSTQGQYYCNTT